MCNVLKSDRLGAPEGSSPLPKRCAQKEAFQTIVRYYHTALLFCVGLVLSSSLCSPVRGECDLAKVPCVDDDSSQLKCSHPALGFRRIGGVNGSSPRPTPQLRIPGALQMMRGRYTANLQIDRKLLEIARDYSCDTGRNPA